MTTQTISITLTGQTPRFGRQAGSSVFSIDSISVPATSDAVQWTVSNPTGISDNTTTIAAVVLADAQVGGAQPGQPPLTLHGVDAFTFFEPATSNLLWQESGWVPPRNPESVGGTVYVAVAPPAGCTLKVAATPENVALFNTWIYFWSTGIGIWYAYSLLQLNGPSATVVVPPFGDTEGAEADFFDDWASSPIGGGGTRALGSPRISRITFYGSDFIEGMTTTWDGGHAIGHGGSNTPATTLDIAEGDYLVYAECHYGPARGQASPFILGVKLLTHQGRRQTFGTITGGINVGRIGEPTGSQQILGFNGFTNTTTLDTLGGIAALGGVLGPAPA